MRRKPLLLGLLLVLVMGLLPGMALAEDAPWEGGSATDLILGEDVEGISGDTYYRFVPDESGYYLFAAQSEDEDCDTYAELCDSEGNYLAGDDDGGAGMMFSIFQACDEGETYYLSVKTYTGGAFTFKVSVAPKVTSLSVRANDDAVFYCGDESKGSWDVISNSEGEEEDAFVFSEWDVFQGYDAEATFEDGTTKRLEYGDFDSITLDWVASENGGTYPMTLTYLGVSTDVDVVVLPNPVEKISFAPVQPYELIEGISAHEVETDDDGAEYYWYWPPNFQEGDQLTVTQKDGKEIVYTYKYNEAEFETLFIADDGTFIPLNSVLQNADNQLKEHWVVGKDCSFTVEYLGQSCSVPVSIIKDSVDSISFEPVSTYELVEGVDGEMHESDDGFEYWCYRLPWFNSGDKLTVSWTDGSSTVFTYDEDSDDFIVDGENPIDANALRSESGFVREYDQFHHPWTVDGDNEFTLMYHGHSCKVPVTIVSNPVKGVEEMSFEPAKPYQYTENDENHGRFLSDSDEDEFFFYDKPSFQAGDKLTFKFENGDSVIYTCQEAGDEDEMAFVSDGGAVISASDLDIYVANQESQPWIVGGENYLFVYCTDHMSCKVPVTIVPAGEDEAQKAADAAAKLVEAAYNEPTDESLKAAQDAVAALDEAAKAKLPADIQSKLDVVKEVLEEAAIEKKAQEAADAAAELIAAARANPTEETVKAAKDAVVALDEAAKSKLPADAQAILDTAAKTVEAAEQQPAKEPAAQTIEAADVSKTFGAKQFKLGATAKTALSYQSSNPKVVTVAADGTVTVVGAGKATISVTAKATADYKSATKTVSVKVAKAKNTMKVKAKKKVQTLKAKDLKKKAKSIKAKKAFKVTKAKGKVTYKVAKYSKAKKKITVSKAGKITVKKGVKKGTYKLKVKVIAKGDANYKKDSKTITIKIAVK